MGECGKEDEWVRVGKSGIFFFKAWERGEGVGESGQELKGVK